MITSKAIDEILALGYRDIFLMPENGKIQVYARWILSPSQHSLVGFIDRSGFFDEIPF